MEINQQKLDDVDEVMRIHLGDIASVTDPYKRGMANGMILIISIINGTDPKFIE